jgi:hypothetical protein
VGVEGETLCALAAALAEAARVLPAVAADPDPAESAHPAVQATAATLAMVSSMRPRSLCLMASMVSRTLALTPVGIHLGARSIVACGSASSW